MPKAKEQPVYEPTDPSGPDNTSVKRDGGFYFTAWGIHVAAQTEGEAKKVLVEAYGVNVDKDQPPHPDHVATGQETE